MSSRSTAWGAYGGIADAIRQRITSGELASGALLPSEHALSAEFDVARNTVRRALAELETEGLITTLPGRGRVVRSDAGSLADASANVPQYRRIAAELRAQIERGELGPGDALPSEATLMERHGVSRGTARQALGALEGAGLVESKHGKGRFVRVR